MFPYHDRYYPYWPYGHHHHPHHHYPHHHDHYGHGGIYNNLISTVGPRYDYYERDHCRHRWDRY
jgi:hypothetical protein